MPGVGMGLGLGLGSGVGVGVGVQWVEVVKNCVGALAGCPGQRVGHKKGIGRDVAQHSTAQHSTATLPDAQDRTPDPKCALAPAAAAPRCR